MSGRTVSKETWLFELSRQTGRNPRTLRRWEKAGCDLEDPDSLREFSQRMGSRLPRPAEQKRGIIRTPETQKPPAELPANDEPIEPGKRGAAAALERLEREEEQAHRRLQAALVRGNTLAIDSAESFWLKCSETLRRLDLAVETARREAETQVPLRVAQEAVTASSEWTRIAFMQFLSAEARALMGIHDIGEWKAYAIERFKGVLHFTVKNAEKTNSAIPDWAVTRIKAAWNVTKADSGAFNEPGVS